MSKGWLDRGVLMLTRQEWPALVRGLNIILKNDEQTDGPETQITQKIFNDDTATIDLQVKSLKGNKLTAKTKTKSRNSKSPDQRRALEQSSEMDMFNSKLHS